METTTLKIENNQFAYLYRQAARSVYDSLPFGMKDEYDIDLIAYIMDLQDRFKSANRIQGNLSVSEASTKDMILYIVNDLNGHHIFPTYSDIIRILDLETTQLVNMGMKVKKVA